MDFKRYISNVLKTESCSMMPIMARLQKKSTIRLLHGMIGMVTEAAELIDPMKKYIFYGKEIDKVNIEEELGDLLWYFAIVCDVLGFDIETIMDKNIAKLQKRYGDTFDAGRAIKRDLDAERRVLDE